MPMYGADVGQLRTLAQRMELAARSLDSIAASLHSQVQGARWDGSDGVRFSSDWSRRYRPDLREVARRLDDAAKVIGRNASEQERTSSSSGGSRPPGSYYAIPGFPFNGRWRNTLPTGPWMLRWFGPGGTLPPGWAMPLDRLESLVRRGSWDMLTIGNAIGDIYDVALEPIGRGAGWMKVGGGVGFAGQAVGSVTAGWRLAEAIDHGDWDAGIRAGIDAAWIVGGVLPPPVGPAVRLVKGTWDISCFVGERISDVGEIIGVNDAIEDSVIGQAIAKAHEADLGTRYDGWGGFWNYSKDYGSALVDGGSYWADKVKFW
jgi:uncharacterized protein YukE